MRVPRDLQDLALNVDRAVTELDLELHRKPTVAEIGAKVGADEEHVLEALEASGAYGPRRWRRHGAPTPIAATP